MEKRRKKRNEDEGGQVESQTGEYGKEMRLLQKWLLGCRYSFVGGYEPVRKISGFQFAATNPHITSRATSIFYLKLEFSKREADCLHHDPFISAHTMKKSMSHYTFTQLLSFLGIVTL